MPYTRSKYADAKCADAGTDDGADAGAHAGAHAGAVADAGAFSAIVCRVRVGQLQRM